MPPAAVMQAGHQQFSVAADGEDHRVRKTYFLFILDKMKNANFFNIRYYLTVLAASEIVRQALSSELVYR